MGFDDGPDPLPLGFFEPVRGEAQPGGHDRRARPAAAHRPRTLEGVAAAGLAGIAVVAGNTIVAEPQAMIALADAKYLFVIGLPA